MPRANDSTFTREQLAPEGKTIYSNEYATRSISFCQVLCFEHVYTLLDRFLSNVATS